MVKGQKTLKNDSMTEKQIAVPSEKKAERAFGSGVIPLILYQSYMAELRKNNGREFME